jgi:cytidylate kinase
MPAKMIGNREISHIIEDQMRQWELRRQEEARSQSRLHLVDSGQAIDYITVSREMGSGGEEVAGILGKLLKWDVYDKEIVEHMARDMRVHTSVLKSVDERTTTWIEDTLAPLFTEESVGELAYYRHLMKVLLVIAKHGRAVFVGRGAGLVLPRDRGLSVRVTAPFELRCQRYARETGASIKEARAIVEKSDRDQLHFVKHLLHQNLLDCKHYDIVFNTEKLSPTSVAKLISRTLDQRKSRS